MKFCKKKFKICKICNFFCKYCVLYGEWGCRWPFLIPSLNPSSLILQFLSSPFRDRQQMGNSLVLHMSLGDGDRFPSGSPSVVSNAIKILHRYFCFYILTNIINLKVCIYVWMYVCYSFTQKLLNGFE